MNLLEHSYGHGSFNGRVKLNYEERIESNADKEQFDKAVEVAERSGCIQEFRYLNEGELNARTEDLDELLEFAKDTELDVTAIGAETNEGEYMIEL